MHPILAQLAGKDPIKNWRDHERDVEKSTSKISAFFIAASEHAQIVAAAMAEFTKNPTPASFAKWRDAETQRPAMFAISQRLRDLAATEREVALLDGGPAKLLAAVAAAEKELDDKEAAIRADDARRSEEIGEPVETTAAFAVIERMREKLRMARMYCPSKFHEARTALNTVLGGSI